MVYVRYKYNLAGGKFFVEPQQITGDAVEGSMATEQSTDFLPHHKLRLLNGGEPLFSLVIQLIDNARESIHLQVYIFEDDETGQRVADALVGAAKRGVAVYVLVDGYGSQQLSRAFRTRLIGEGVHFRIFEPLFRGKRFYIGRRMHQKLLVVDAQYAVVTGANIGNRYNDMPGQPAWLDFAVCVEGEVAQKLCELCWTTWKNFARIRYMPKQCKPADVSIDFGHTHEGGVRMRRNDWVRRKSEITRTYRELFRNARERIILVSSYFLPGATVRRDMSNAVKRGVNIQVMVCSRMDVPLVKDAERSLYEWLLRHGIEIYEYTGDMLHGKLAVCDTEWMTVGSYNMNELSARVSVELNLDVREKDLVQRTVDRLNALMDTQCVRVSNDSFAAQTTFMARIFRGMALRILRLIFFLGTFYMKQEKYRGT